MKKDHAKPSPSPEPAAEQAVPQAVEQLSMGQAVPPVEHLKLPEAIEGEGAEGVQILAQEYRESAKMLGRSETTEQALVQLAEHQGKPPDEVISTYLHEQLPRHDFYNQPVLLGD